MKQTAVDWIVDQVEDFIGLIPTDIIEKAKKEKNPIFYVTDLNVFGLVF